MGDTFGAITVPIGSPADPALALIGDYLKTILNANAQAGFELGRYGDGEVVKTVFTVNPNGFVFDDELLPALFVHAPSGQFEQAADDWLEDTTALKVVWMLPTLGVEAVDVRREFFRPVAKLIAAALRTCRDPLWQWPADTDVESLSIEADDDSLVLSIATALAPVTLSGAGLTGQRAGQTFSPRLSPTVTTDIVGVDTFNTTSPILFTGVDWYGRTRTRSKTLTKVRGGETLFVNEDIRSVTSITQPAHLSTLGTIRFGTLGWNGKGSLLKKLAGLSHIRVGGWRAQPVTITELDGDAATKPARSAVYETLEVDVAIREVEEIDRSAHFAGIGLDIDTTQGGMVAQRSLPDA